LLALVYALGVRVARAQGGSGLVGVMEVSGYTPNILVAVDRSGFVYRANGYSSAWTVDAGLPTEAVSISPAAPGSREVGLIGLVDGEVWGVYTNGFTVSVSPLTPNVFGGPTSASGTSWGQLKARYR
jgi:hypothetical protein